MRCSSREYLHVELAVDGLPVLVDQFERMGAVAVHVAMAVRDSTIAKQESNLSEQEGRKGEGSRNFLLVAP